MFIQVQLSSIYVGSYLPNVCKEKFQPKQRYRVGASNLIMRF